MNNDKTDVVSQLGNHNTKYEYSNPSLDILETFENQYPYRDYTTAFEFNEFTSLCPVTGQPDFATIYIRYTPNFFCIETKSLKLYLLAYRQYGSFMETIINKILDDCVEICFPKKMKVLGKFNARGGTKINVISSYRSPYFYA